MERNTTTTLALLQFGDRFYKLKDKKKMLYEKVEHKPKQTYYQTYRHWALKDGHRDPDPMRGDTEVVFLRNKNEL